MVAAPSSKVFQELLLVHEPTVRDTMPAPGELSFSVGLLAAAPFSDGSCRFPVLEAVDHPPCTDLHTSQVLWDLRAHTEHRLWRQLPAGPVQSPPLAAVRNKLLKNITSAFRTASGVTIATANDNKLTTATIFTHFLHAGTILIYFIFITIL